ncbi:MAG TPA: hypothetical protein PKC89_14600 [Pyrinomonadaceae bacterium]|nr:hypothetical protein [Pyrinomonadaceae bacterium]
MKSMNKLRAVLDIAGSFVGLFLLVYVFNIAARMSSPDEPFPVLGFAITCGVFAAAYLAILLWRGNTEAGGLPILVLAALTGTLMYFAGTIALSIALGHGDGLVPSVSLWIFLAVVVLISTSIPALIFRAIADVIRWLGSGSRTSQDHEDADGSGERDAGGV